MSENFDAQRSCLSKGRYATAEIAQSIANRIQRDRGTILRVYACTLCGGHHLTHQLRHENVPRPGWRPAKLSARDEAQLRKYDRQRGRKR